MLITLAHFLDSLLFISTLFDKCQRARKPGIGEYSETHARGAALVTAGLASKLAPGAEGSSGFIQQRRVLYNELEVVVHIN